MNVIIYWKSGGYADVYNVDEVQRPSQNEPDLRLFQQHKGEKFEVARFEGADMSGWQIFLTAEDAKRDDRPRA